MLEGLMSIEMLTVFGRDCGSSLMIFDRSSLVLFPSLHLNRNLILKLKDRKVYY